MDDSLPTKEYDDSFISHAARCTSQYDLTCRTLAAEVERRRAQVKELVAIEVKRDRIEAERDALTTQLDALTAAAREVILADVGIDGAEAAAADEAASIDRYGRAIGVLRKLVYPKDEGPMPHEVLAAAREMVEALIGVPLAVHSARLATAEYRLRKLVARRRGGA